MSLSAVNRRPSINLQHLTDEKDENCYICHCSEHPASECSQCVQQLSSSFQHDESVSEVYVDYDDSDSESENE